MYYKNGDTMKKQVILGSLILLLGLLLGSKIYQTNLSLTDVFADGTTYYFLQEGIYTSKVILDENTKNINAKLIVEENSKYYVYLGITKSEEIATKLKKIYEQAGHQIYIKEIKLSNPEFESNVTQFDLLVNSATSNDEILTIEEVVLANYEEIVQKQ